jgi:hypothetical protein
MSEKIIFFFLVFARSFLFHINNSINIGCELRHEQGIQPFFYGEKDARRIQEPELACHEMDELGDIG